MLVQHRLANPNGGVGTAAYLFSMFVVFFGALSVLIALRQPKVAVDVAIPAPAKVEVGTAEAEPKPVAAETAP